MADTRKNALVVHFHKQIHPSTGIKSVIKTSNNDYQNSDCQNTQDYAEI